MIPLNVIVGARAVIFKEIPHFDWILPVHPCPVEVVIEVSYMGCIWCCVLDKLKCVFHMWHGDESHR